MEEHCRGAPWRSIVEEHRGGAPWRSTVEEHRGGEARNAAVQAWYATALLNPEQLGLIHYIKSA